MSSDLFGVTGAVLRAALDAASLRQSVGATNIANANVVGYAPLRVSFEEALGQALRSQGADSSSFEIPEPQVYAEPVSSSGLGDASVKVDDEAARLSTNVIQYQALLQGLNGQMSILQTAINDGKS